MANELLSESWPGPWSGPESGRPLNAEPLAARWWSRLPPPAGSERWTTGVAPAIARGAEAHARPTPLFFPGHSAERAAHEPGWPDDALRPAYAACSQVIRTHSASFYFSAGLLPPVKRQAVLALYAFCRLSDDLVDTGAARGEPAAETERALTEWAGRCRAARPADDEHEPVVQAWADTRRRFAIPQALADELLAGVRMDISISRYATWADLWIYCYRVASTVGQMSMHITGAIDRAATNYAIRLGVALQLTNILRDVGEDARQGRIYLPLADLARFGYRPQDSCKA